MSNVRKASSATAVTPSIILLENYPALATAITSALRKFAPHHSAHTARSLKELESLAADLEPELLIIDVDPPWPKLTQLLGKLRSSHPATRALVIGATVPKEIIDQHGSQRALQFLQNLSMSRNRWRRDSGTARAVDGHGDGKASAARCVVSMRSMPPSCSAPADARLFSKFRKRTAPGRANFISLMASCGMPKTGAGLVSTRSRKSLAGKTRTFAKTNANRARHRNGQSRLPGVRPFSRPCVIRKRSKRKLHRRQSDCPNQKLRPKPARALS